MRKNLCYKYFFKIIVFIVEQFHNAIIDPETDIKKKGDLGPRTCDSTTRALNILYNCITGLISTMNTIPLKKYCKKIFLRIYLK